MVAASLTFFPTAAFSASTAITGATSMQPNVKDAAVMTPAPSTVARNAALTKAWALFGRIAWRYDRKVSPTNRWGRVVVQYPRR